MHLVVVLFQYTPGVKELNEPNELIHKYHNHYVFHTLSVFIYLVNKVLTLNIKAAPRGVHHTY